MAEEEQEPPPPPPPASSNKKAKLKVDPNATLQETERTHYLTCLPALPEGSSPFTPTLYAFRIKHTGKPKNFKNIYTRAPPFYLLLDHAIAVIWTLFSSGTSDENLGIVQLQWAAHFLKSVFNSDGVHPKDVQLCIEAIEDCLIDKYAEISEQSVVYGNAKFCDYIKEEPSKVPFSLNYSQLSDKTVVGVSEKESDIIEGDLLAELESMKQSMGIESLDLTKSVSKDKAINVLNEWKKEQISKIQDEFKMLHTVEDMMKNVDSTHFDGYTDQNEVLALAQRD